MAKRIDMLESGNQISKLGSFKGGSGMISLENSLVVERDQGTDDEYF
jgi:hypothetical protein